MRTMINKVFFDHPASVEENYFEHMIFAGRFALLLLGAAGAALVHAIIPCLFEKTASNLIRKMHARIHNR
ncbi:MAG: hypothetical protein HRU27_10605 [Rhizobiaceae bacterium]|nr:DUF6356 family protein [Hyphomicrobiales bacterium]NRB31034.1 hypothetical protein [Rhizobiaceae bacterium]